MPDYNGPVVFIQGVHYPADEHGYADTTRPLRWVEGVTYRDAEPGEQQHNDLHYSSDKELWPGEEDA